MTKVIKKKFKDTAVMNIVDKILELSQFIADKSRKGVNPYCITDSKNSEFVEEWLKTHSFPVNGMFLTKEICKKLK